MVESIVPRAVVTLEKTGAMSSDAKKLRGKVGSGIGGFRGLVLSSRLALLRVTRWLQHFQTSLLDTAHVQRKEQTIFKNKEASPETA